MNRKGKEIWALMSGWVRQIKYEDVLLVTIGIILSFLLRFALRGYQTNDFLDTMNGWIRTIKDQGFAAFRGSFSNYTPFYLYTLYIISKLFPGIANVTAIKIPAILCDFLCAYFIYRIVRLKFPTGPAPFFALFAFLFAPTVVLNSAFWGQIDVLYTTGLVACVYYAIKGKDWQASLWFGIGLSIKLQAIFLAPFLLILFIKRKMSWKALLLIPAVYLVSLVPAWIAGRPLTDLLMIYFYQTSLFTALSSNAPNVYAWIPRSFSDQLFLASLIFGGSICFMFLWTVVKSRAALTDSLMIQLAFLSVILLPFFLPRMHDRYFYPADVFSILYAFFLPEYFFVPLVVLLVSFLTYGVYLFQTEIIPGSILAIALLGVIALTARKLVLTLFPPAVSNQDAETEELESDHV